jgi:hypothetical protein
MTEKRKTSSKTSKPKPKAEAEFKCGFCNKEFVAERTLMTHMCVKKLRDLDRDEKYSRMALHIYRKFHEANWKHQKEKTWGDFINSRYYNEFVKVGKYIQEINAISPMLFIDFLIRSRQTVNKWTNPVMYETFVRELTKNESPDAAVKRNILLMEQWATETGNHWTDFFREVSPAQATLWIKNGRISPWVLYISSSSQDLFERLSPEQINIVGKYLDPGFWEARMQRHKEEIDFLRTVFDEAGV